MQLLNFSFALDASKGGVPRSVSNLALQLKKYDLNSYIYSFGNSKNQIVLNKSLIENLATNGIKFWYSQALIQNNYGIGSLKKLNRIILEFSDADLIVLHQVYTLSTLFGYRIAKRSKVPYAIMPHGSLTKYHESDNRMLKQIAKKIIVNKILRSASAIVVTCKSEKEDLDISLQSKACIFNFGEIINEEIMNLNSQIRVNSGIRIMFSGRFDKKKNLPLLLMAMPEILKIYPNLTLDIAGSGSNSEIDILKKMVSKLNLENNTCFHGWVDQNRIYNLLNQSKLLVLPSANENFALVVSEALSVGVPCVVSKFVGTSDIVAKHNAGEVVNELTPASIAAAVIKVLQGDEYAYRAAAFKATREELDWYKISLQWKALIKSVAVQ